MIKYLQFGILMIESLLNTKLIDPANSNNDLAKYFEAKEQKTHNYKRAKQTKSIESEGLDGWRKEIPMRSNE